MTKTINVTRTARETSTTGLTGTESPVVEGNDEFGQAISAGTEEQTAMGAFKDHQLKVLSLRSDQPVDVQFLGVRYPITALNVLAPDTLTHVGDQTDEIFEGDLIRLEGTVAADGLYLVETVAAGVITVALGNAWVGGAGGAVGTFARVCSHQYMGYRYDIATATLATGIITILGDVSDVFADGDWLEITDSTGNNGIHEILTVATDGPPVTTTTITVVGAALPDNTDDGELYKVRPAIELTANVPFLWSIASGIQNPFIFPTTSIDRDGESPLFNEFRGDVTNCMVNNEGASVANFLGLAAKDAIIF